MRIDRAVQALLYGRTEKDGGGGQAYDDASQAESRNGEVTVVQRLLDVLYKTAVVRLKEMGQKPDGSISPKNNDADSSAIHNSCEERAHLGKRVSQGICWEYP
jgi:hypothetical protein